VNVSILSSLTKGTPSHSLLTTDYSQITIHHCQFTIAHSPLKIHD